MGEKNKNKSKVKEFEVYNSKIISDVVIFKPSIHSDNRGSIYTTFHNDVFSKYIPKKLEFKHDKFAESVKDSLRGIHGDIKSWKLVTCVSGEVFQVIVDCRKNSPTYLSWESFLINKDMPISILLPPGLGNAFQVTKKTSIYHYKLAYEGDYLDAEDQFTYKWNDSKIGIKWPNINPILSNRDK